VIDPRFRFDFPSLEGQHMLPIARGAILSIAATFFSLTTIAVSPVSAQTYKVGNLVVTAPWARATPKGAPVAGGYLSITNNGSEPDRLVGGSFAAAGRFEVHEMKMEGGIMKMRPLPRGLEIKPGETVELKPGGYHLMFMALKQQLKAGETVKGTLEFAKAGKVEVSYPVRSLGSPGAGGHKGH
jgi:copper(I)-binding protein